MEHLQIKNLYNLEETIAVSLFDGAVYPWELLPKIGTYIVELGKTLPADKYVVRTSGLQNLRQLPRQHV